MTGASLAVCVVLGQLAADPSDLVSRLGAPRYPAREEAATALERLGRKALPALRAARDVKDPEVRTRASVLIARIEGSLLTLPTTVKLDFRDAPLRDVIRSVSDQTGIKLLLVPDNSTLWQTRRVTLREDAPLPFWKAVDRLCDAAHLQYNTGMNGFPGREPTFPLFDGEGRPALPVSDSGPFRVSVVGLHFQRDVNFSVVNPGNRGLPGQSPPARPGHAVNEQCFAQLQVAGEPRLTLTQVGTLRITEAVDETGQALASPPAGGSTTQRISGYYGFVSGPVIQIQAALVRPKQPGKLIKKLKGTIPLSVSSRKPGPLTVPLTGTAGRTFQNDDVVITVNEVREPQNNRPGAVEVTLRPAGGLASLSGFSPNDLMIRPETNPNSQQIELLDPQGRLMTWYSSGFDAEAGRLTMGVPSHEPGMKPVELRFYGLVRAATEVPFEFSDLPMP